MTSPIDPYRTDAWRRIRDDADPLAATTRPVAPPRVTRNTSELPALPDVHADLLARAARVATSATAPSTPRPLLAGLVDATATVREMTPAQRRLDAFLDSATPTFHTPEGDVSVSIGFWMGGPGPKESALRQVATATGIGKEDQKNVLWGRGSPEVLGKLTQALIAHGGLPPSDGVTPLSVRVRQMMQDYGIGIDCAGYVQQALVAALGVTRERAHLQAVAGEDLSGLAGRGYRRVTEADLRPGDIIALGPRPEDVRLYGIHAVGHRAIVSDQHMADASELAELARTSPRSEVQRAVAGGKVRVIVVDSSWGSGSASTPQAGGVERRTWFHDESSGTWLWRGNGGIFHVTSDPYDHPLDPARGGGMYRLGGT